jgi:predicted O-linked N-acetylglucosamine transferase (SPINDLY family)
MANGSVGQRLQAAFGFHKAGRLDEAARQYRDVINADPNNFQALHYLGLIEAGKGRFDEARSLIARSLKIHPDIAFVENYAGVLLQMGDHAAAREVCAENLARHPNSGNLLYVSACALLNLQELDAALTQFDRLIALQPRHVAALNERGSVLSLLGRNDAALDSIRKALAIAPAYAEAHLNLGNVSARLQRHAEAMTAYETALRLNPELADACRGIGNILKDRQRYDEAIAFYDKALALKPGLAGAWLGRGNALYERGRFPEAAAAYDKAEALSPNVQDARAMSFFTGMRICQWDGFAPKRDALLSSIRGGAALANPLWFLGVAERADDQLSCAARYAQHRHGPSTDRLWKGERYDHDRLRVAYVSADFRAHAVSYLLAGAIERHDRTRFETFGMVLNANYSDPMGERMRRAFEHFIPVAQHSDREIATLLREREIDIAVDLMGYTQGSRTDIFAVRPAPVQVNYLGFPATMGVDYIDYIVADDYVVPASLEAAYREKVIRLPETFQANDASRPIPARIPLREEAGLPPDAFVFCAFNGAHKITPAMFDVWMRLLRTVEGSVLWLVESNQWMADNLRREAAARGVEADRLVFAAPAPYADYLVRYRLADLFLDTFPFNGGTTTSDVLWTGLPLVTLAGEALAGRMAGSLLTTVGVPELIASSFDEYEAMALALARDRERLGSLRTRIEAARTASPLFDAGRFCRHLEAAYAAMVERSRCGEPPAPIRVAPLA